MASLKHLSEIKEHLQKEHEQGKYLNHLKMDINDANKVDFKHISIDKEEAKERNNILIYLIL